MFTSCNPFSVAQSSSFWAMSWCPHPFLRTSYGIWTTLLCGCFVHLWCIIAVIGTPHSTSATSAETLLSVSAKTQLLFVFHLHLLADLPSSALLLNASLLLGSVSASLLSFYTIFKKYILPIPMVSSIPLPLGEDFSSLYFQLRSPR